MARQKVKVLLSRRAERDLTEIYCYLGERSLAGLARVDQAVFRSLRRLAIAPLSGHMVRELPSRKYHEVLVYHYRIIYQYLEKKRLVRVMTIYHGKRLLPAKFEMN